MVGLVFLLWACATSDNVNERIKYWKDLANTELPIGSTKDQVLVWAQKHSLHPSGMYPPPQGFYGNYASYFAESVPVERYLRVCAEWEIILDFHFDANNLLIKQEVNEHGVCL